MTNAVVMGKGCTGLETTYRLLHKILVKGDAKMSSLSTSCARISIVSICYIIRVASLGFL
jgi:hypothetical protein